MWGGMNKRKFPRAEYPCKIVLKRKDHPDEISGKTENIGVGGICVILSKDLGIFAPVQMQVDLLDGRSKIECEGSIVWIVRKKQDKDTIFDTGIEFANLKKEDKARIEKVVENILNGATA